MKITPYFVNHQRHQRVVLIELAVVLLAFVLTYALSSFFSASDHFYEWAQQYEKTSDIDELIFALLGFLLALMWFSTRRMNESRKLTLHNHILLQRLLKIQEDERKAIAQHLHDDLGQYLNAIKAHAASLSIDSANNEDTLFAGKCISNSAEHAYNATRLLMHNLRPVALDELGLSAAIEHIVDSWKTKIHNKNMVKYQLDIVGDIDCLTENTNIAIFRIVQEALTNIAKHAKASSVYVAIKISNTLLNISVHDNGVGFDVNQKTSDKQLQACYGLLGIAERAAAIAGKLEIISTPKLGTRISVEVKR